MHRAKAALERNAWRESFDLFGQADAAGLLSPSDMMLYADSANWCGQVPRTVELHERAYAAFSAKDNPEGAARAAMRPFTNCESGWLQRYQLLTS